MTASLPRALLPLLLLSAVGVPGAFGMPEEPTPIPTAHPPVSPPPVRPYPFEVGEKLEYVVTWFKITAGTMALKVRELTEFAGHPALRLTATGATSKKFSLFFKVRDRYDSFVREADLVSLYFLKDIREGRYRAKRQEVFDHETGIARYRKRVARISPDARDIIASLYYLRTVPLPEGGKVPLNAHGDGRSYRVDAEVVGRRTVRVPAGEFATVELRPVSTFQGRVYKSDSSALSIFLTDDERRIPVLVTSKLAIGKLKAELREIHP